MITLVLVLRHSIEKHSNTNNYCNTNYLQIIFVHNTYGEFLCTILIIIVTLVFISLSQNTFSGKYKLSCFWCNIFLTKMFTRQVDV